MSTPTPQPNATGAAGAYPVKPGSPQDVANKLVSALGAASAAPSPSGKFGVPTDNSPIYLGKRTAPPGASEKYSTSHDTDYGKLGGGLGTAAPVSGNNTTSYAQARLAPLDWSDNQLAQFVNKGVMNKVPGFDVNMGMPEVLSAWDDLIKSAYGMNSKDPENPKWTPDDVMNTYANPKGKFGTVTKGNWEYDIATGEKIRYVGPLSKTTTATQINELTREDAMALAKNSMATMLGRAPTAGEVGQYLNILNGYEREHPQTTTTTTQIDPTTGEAADSSSTTTGGTTAAGKQALLEEQMKQSPEYGAFQAATTGMSWLGQAISKGVY